MVDLASGGFDAGIRLGQFIAPDMVAVRLTPTGVQIETTVPPPALSPRMNVVRLEIPYGRMRRRVDLPPGSYVLIERRLERGCLFLRLTKEAP